MRKVIWFFIIPLFIACNANRSNQEATADMASSESEPFDSKQKVAEVDENTSKKDLAVSSQKLIKTGYLSIEVENYRQSRQKIKQLVERHGGYLGNETEQNETYRITNDIVIRVPSKTFDLVMEGLIAEGIKVDSKRIEVADVGEEFADLEARIVAKKAIEKRYLEILNKASKISDILEIEEKVRVIREETEAAQGRLNYLQNQVALSTINLNVYKTLDANYTPASGPSFITRLGKGAMKGWEAILNFLVGFIYLWPLWILLLATWLWFRRRKLNLKFWETKKPN
jgi:hypothetical protein